MTLSEKGKELFQRYPAQDFDLDRARSNVPRLFEQYMNVQNKLTTAMLAENEYLFNVAEKEFLELVEKFRDYGWYLPDVKAELEGRPLQMLHERIQATSYMLTSYRNQLSKIAPEYEKWQTRVEKAEAELQDLKNQLKQEGTKNV